MSIGKNLKTIRELHHMSQAEFGKIAGVSDKAVSAWETEVRIPRMGAIEKIALHFGIQKSDIIEDSKNKKTAYEENLLDGLTEEDFKIIEYLKTASQEEKEALRAVLKIRHANEGKK